MSATGHQLRRRTAGATRVMELLGDNPDIAQFNERFKTNASTKEDLFERLKSRSDVDGIAVQLEQEPIRQNAEEKAPKADVKAEDEKPAPKAPKAPKAKK